MARRTLPFVILSGLLLAASFPNIGFSFLAWFALVPFLFSLKGLTVRAGLQHGFIVGLIFFCGTVSWIANSISTYGHVPFLPTSIITLLFCAVLALFIALFGAAFAHIQVTHPRFLLLTAPALWVALEYARTHLFSGFPWALLGYSQYRSLPVIQIADLTGVYGISFLLMLVNTAIAVALTDRKIYYVPATALVVTAVVLVYGYSRLAAPIGSEGVKIAIIQGNIEQDKKWAPSYRTEVIAAYKQLTLNATEKRPDLVIWPETATPYYFAGHDAPYPALTEALRQFVRSSGTPLLFGSPTYERKDRQNLLRNTAFLLGPDGATRSVYNKMHLVPFGEYVPMKSALFFVDKLVQAKGDFQPGSEFTVMKVRLRSGLDVSLGTVICYEIIFPDLVRRFVNEGASVIANITNDAWFGRTGAPYQHFSMAVLRAVENRVPVARAANTGISGFIDAQGRILASTGIFTEAVLTGTLTPGTTKTLYTRYGDVFAWLCVLVTVIAVLPCPGEHKPDLVSRQ